uniref:Uncharacterized protein n=1 Tax=Panagrolaimus sp. JU765 TaxID=591449 RepID=A0AC34Q7F2_9BILA
MINLPEVVGKLFMLDDTFFKSHFLREKLPPLLFSNGSNGFDRFFQDFDGPRSRVNREVFYEDDSDGPPTPTPFDNSGSSQNGSFAFFDGRNQQSQKSGVVRNIPIKVEGHFQQQNFATTSEPQPAAYSQNYQTPYFASVSASIQTPNSNSFSVPILQRQTSQPVIRKEEPDTISFRSIQFPSEERTGTFKRSQRTLAPRKES